MKIKSFSQPLAHLSVAFSLLAACLVFFTGCETTTKYNPKDMGAPEAHGSNDVVLREADALKVSFPGAESMDTSTIIRRDGKITLPVVGEVMAAGKTPADLQKELVQLYSKELVSSKDISVSVLSATFPIYLTGAIQKPGKIISDHPLTVLEAVMEAGGPDPNANLKSVKVIRTQDGKTRNYNVNLKGLLTGKSIDIFYLQPADIIYLPTKITWF